MVLGFVWYGPLFGKKYMRLQGVTEAEVEKYKKDPVLMRKMMRNYLFTFILALITAFVLEQTIALAGPSMPYESVMIAVIVAFMGWLGFVVPATTNLIFFDKKNWEWWFLVNGYYLIQLVLISLVVSF